MKEFQYTIQDPMGFHARPAGALVRAAKAYASKVTISCGEKSAQLTRLMAEKAGAEAQLSQLMEQWEALSLALEGEG